MKPLILSLLCKLFGHKYFVYAKPQEPWAKGIRWLRCSRCKRDFALNANVRALLPMTFDLTDMHEWEVLSSDSSATED